MQIVLNICSDFIKTIQGFNVMAVVFRILLAAILGGIIGMERSKSGQAAGLRTHILVSLGATIASMTGLYIHYNYGTGDIGRIAAQVISGIGFLGAGTILVRNSLTVTGLTTAACIWATGAVGIAIGYGFYEAAIFATIFIFVITDKLTKVDEKIRHHKDSVQIYFECADVKKLNQTIQSIKLMFDKINSIQLEESKTNDGGIGVKVLAQCNHNDKVDDTVEKINALENVNFAIMIG